MRAAALLLTTKDEEIEHLRFLLWGSNLRLAELEAEAASKEPGIKFDKQPLYMSEEEEDIQFQLDQSLIDTKTAEALLKDLEFDNSEVQFDPEYTYENFHY